MEDIKKELENMAAEQWDGQEINQVQIVETVGEL